MKYFMKFQTSDTILSSSDKYFKDLNIQELKNRFNSEFVQNKDCSAVTIYFKGNGVDKSFIAGFRNQNDNSQKVCIVDMQTKKEYSPKEFSKELNILQTTL